MTKVNLEEELNKIRKAVEDTPQLFGRIKLSSLEEAREPLKMFLKYGTSIFGLKPDVRDILYQTFMHPDGPFKRRADKSVRAYSPKDFYRRLRGMPGFLNSSYIKERCKRMGFKGGFNIDAKNFIVNAYKIIYDAYIKDQAEEDIRKRDICSELRYAMRR